tara:strand:- start:189 stop:512 length:324 start_codon:yes stop_codon:yes gene_type:complete
MKINKFIIIFLSILVFTGSCQSMKEGLTGTKRSKSSDEFLVQKKSPLVMPPNFEKMPLPNMSEKKKLNNNSIEKLLNLSKEEKEIVKNKSKSEMSLENSILEKITNN